MKNTCITLMMSALLLTASCQQKTEDQGKDSEMAEVKEQESSGALGGVINTGEYAGKKFTLYDGKEVGYMKKMIENYNNLDASEIRKYSADSVKMLSTNGQISYTKEGDMAGYFATLDSVDWVIDAMIPLKIEGTNVVKIMLDTREVGYPKQGNPYKVSLLEEFTFEDGQMVSVRQWSRELL